MKFTLSVAEGIRQQRKNTVYSTHAVITSVEELCKAVQFDHLAGLFRDDKRANTNFIQADAVMMDCDNDGTDNPNAWLTPEKLSEQLQDVPFIAVGSRNNMKDKVTKDKKGNVTSVLTARPRFHVYMPLSEVITEAKVIRELKLKLRAFIPDFDKCAADTARMFFGVANPQAEIFEGDTCIDEFIAISGIEPETEYQQDTHEQEQHSTENDEQQERQDDTIKPGDRHGTLLKVAVEALSKYGEEKARKLLYKAAERCKPPKPVAEVNSIWEWALSKHNELKAKLTETKKTLTLPIIEETLQSFNISVRFDVITKQLSISDLPADSPYIPASYSRLTGKARKKANIELTPLFLESYFKDKQFKFNREFLKESIAAIANTNFFNPIQDMLNATQWDGVDRLRILMEKLELLHDRHGNKASYYCACLRKWLHQALALAFNDEGTRAPAFALTLQGPQGVGKTSFFRALAVRPEWFREATTINMQVKDTIIQSTSTWITELGELDATLRKEQSDLKGFLTAKFDTYRRPYARTFDTIERRTCFCATVNPQEVNRDVTGSRRFVYISLDGIDAAAFKQFIYHTMTPEWTAQLWRQVYEELYLPKPEEYFMTDDELQFNEQNNAPHRVPIKAETELRDLIAWETIGQTDNEGYDMCEWHEYRATEVKQAYTKTLSRFDAREIGKALTLLCEEYGASYRESKRIKIYRIPKLKKREDEDTSKWQGYN